MNEGSPSVEAETISPGQGSLRLFVAVELPEDVKQALREAIATLKRAGIDDGLRWARLEGIHLTLKFLGATPPAKVPAIATALRDALAGATPFELRPEGLGTFHGGRNPHFTRKFPREAYPSTLRVLWVGVSGDTDRLADLAARIETALEPHGVEREKRPFSAHLTLARVRDEADRATRERLSHALA
ncbi:MAG: RNA 2',3'-cyclic phosphodiesterase, partial [Candidatus Rokuibacteriota bacterium]